MFSEIENRKKTPSAQLFAVRIKNAALDCVRWFRLSPLTYDERGDK